MAKSVDYKLSAPEKYSERRSTTLSEAKPYRSEFQRDRDRILYSKAFRRLSGKTQVYLCGSDDHLRTRLTHTLEVAQIARVIASNLKLDETLTEAIALGHDVGHTPFGHVGERTLNLIMNGCDRIAACQSEMTSRHKGFKHNWQSVRVASDLERLYEGPGLNLTNFTLWGMLHHTRCAWRSCDYLHVANGQDRCYLKRMPSDCERAGQLDVSFYAPYRKYTLLNKSGSGAWSFEALVVAIADEIAQRHHDVEDGLRTGAIAQHELLTEITERFDHYLDSEDRSFLDQLRAHEGDVGRFIPFVSKLVVGLLSKKVIHHSIDQLNQLIDDQGFESRKDFKAGYKSLQPADVAAVIGFPPEFERREAKFQSFLKNRILDSFEVQRMDGKGRFIIRQLFKAYVTNPRQLHDSTIISIFTRYDPPSYQSGPHGRSVLGQMRRQVGLADARSDSRFQLVLLRAICDHVAGMTDSFALDEYARLYGSAARAARQV